MNRRDMMPLFIVIAAMIVLNILNGDFSDFGSWVYRQLLMLPGIVIGLTVHEFAHGLVSDRCGDPTPRAQGRLTLNPAAHIDLIGFLCLFFAGFGWGQPVQIDPRYYKHRRMDEFLVSIAGVTMNFIVAVALAFVLRLIMHSGSAFFSTTTGDVILNMVQYGIFINLVLMIFNPDSGAAAGRLGNPDADLRSGKIQMVSLCLSERILHPAGADTVQRHQSDSGSGNQRNLVVDAEYDRNLTSSQ